MATPVITVDVEKDNDGGELAHQAMLLETADEALAKGGAIAEVAPKEWTVERACQIFDATVNEQFNRGAITEGEKLAWTALAKTLPSHYDVFSYQAAMLWRVLEMSCAKAKRNHDRLLKIPTHGFMDKNEGWISCVLRVASEHLLLPHSSVFPGDDGFVSQSTTEAGRTTLRRLISQLMEVSLIATCNGCGELVAFDKKGEPFTKCKKCRDADRRANELKLLNEQLEEKKALIEPLDHLLTELSAAGSYWVDDMVQKGWEKAQVAFDNAFKQQIDWLTKQVADLWVTIKTGDITEVDGKKVENMAGYIRAEIEKVRTFQHLTWCRTCKAPTYPWVHPRKKIQMKPNDNCDTCRHAEKEMAKVAEQRGSVLSADDLRAAELAGVSVTAADGTVLVEAEIVEPAFDPGDKYARAWDRKKKGQAIEKGKSKKK